MKRLLLVVILNLVALNLYAQSLIYGIEFYELFDNREIENRVLPDIPAETIFGAVLSPWIGIQIDEHQLIMNPNICKEFGSSKAFFDIAFWYRLRTEHFRISAGIFPCTDSHEYWSTAFISEKLQWNRPYLNGLMFAYDGENYNYELGLDWIGLYGDTPITREEFAIFSAGHQNLNKRWTIAYNAFMHHFACSPIINNVSDDVLIEPYVKFDMNLNEKFQEFYLKCGPMLSLQRDRDLSGGFDTNLGFELMGVIKKWNFKLDNRLYLGSHLQTIDTQENLYFGSPYFAYCKNYDRLEFSYCPKLGKYAELNIALVFHINHMGFVGSQQKIGLNFIFDNL